MTIPIKRAVGVAAWPAWSILCGAVAIWLIDLAMQPIPMPAGGAIAFGVIGFWVVPKRRRVIGGLCGMAAGAALGTGLHVWSHVAEDRVESIASLLAHVAVDTAVSLLLAGAALAVALLPAVLAGRCAREGDESSYSSPARPQPESDAGVR
jgi:hypothetical protein